MSLTERNENKIERKRKRNIFIFLWIISATAAATPARKINWTAPKTIKLSKIGDFPLKLNIVKKIVSFIGILNIRQKNYHANNGRCNNQNNN